jgi:transcriptional regulator with XRE-family HTH domain
MTNDVTKFGKALREIRLKKKLSQGDIAKKLGVHRSYISGLEHGKRNPSLLTIKKMAKAIGVEPKELLEYE